MFDKLKRFVNKPEYYFRPRQLLRRFNIGSCRAADLIWGHKNFNLNPNETIGRSILTFGLYDLVVSEALYRLVKPGSVCLDIGANIGVFSSLMQARGAHVHSFEPHPEIFKKLERNCETLTNVTCHSIALSDSAGHMPLYIPESFAKNEGIASLNPQSGAKEVSVRTDTLDNIFRNAVIDLIKIDVEGHELSVLRGGVKLFRDNLVNHIIFEDFNGESSEVVRFFKEHDYQVYRLVKGFFNLKLIDINLAKRIPLWEPPNYIATRTPKELTRFGHWQVLKSNSF